MRHLAALVAIEKRTLAGRVLHALPEQLVAAEVQRPRTEQPFLEDPGAREQVEVLALTVMLARAGTGPVREVTAHRDGVRGSVAVSDGEVPGPVFGAGGGEAAAGAAGRGRCREGDVGVLIDGRHLGCLVGPVARVVLG